MAKAVAKKAKIGVLGASGYTGAELVRLLIRHPRSLSLDLRSWADLQGTISAETASSRDRLTRTAWLFICGTHECLTEPYWRTTPSSR